MSDPQMAMGLDQLGPVIQMFADYEARLRAAHAGADEAADEKLMRTLEKDLRRQRVLLERYLENPNKIDPEKVSEAVATGLNSIEIATGASQYVANPERYRHREGKSGARKVLDTAYWVTGGPVGTAVMSLNPYMFPWTMFRMADRALAMGDTWGRRSINNQMSYDPADYQGWAEQLGYVPPGDPNRPSSFNEGGDVPTSNWMGDAAATLRGIQVPDWVNSILVSQVVKAGPKAIEWWNGIGGAEGLLGAASEGLDAIPNTRTYKEIRKFITDLSVGENLGDWAAAAKDFWTSIDWAKVGDDVKLIAGRVYSYVTEGGLERDVANLGQKLGDHSFYTVPGLASGIAMGKALAGDMEGAYEYLNLSKAIQQTNLAGADMLAPHVKMMWDQENWEDKFAGDMGMAGADHWLKVQAMNAELARANYAAQLAQANYFAQNGANGQYVYGYGPGGMAESLSQMNGLPFEPMENRWVQLPDIPGYTPVTAYEPFQIWNQHVMTENMNREMSPAELAWRASMPTQPVP